MAPKRRNSISGGSRRISNETKKQIMRMPRRASESDARTLNLAEHRAVFHVAREKYTAQILEVEGSRPVKGSKPAKRLGTCLRAIRMGVHAVIVEKRVLEVWMGYRRCSNDETFTEQREPVGASGLRSDAHAASLLYQFNALRHIEELRLTLMDLSTGTAATDLLNSIATATTSMKASLAALCDRATLHVSVLDLLDQSVDSQFTVAHELLLSWVKELQVMQHHLKQKDQKQDTDKRNLKVSLAIDNCLQSTSILSDAWQDQHLSRVDCHVLIKFLRTIQEHGLPSTEKCPDSSSTHSGKLNGVLRFLEVVQKHRMPAKEERTDFTTNSSCNKEPEHDIGPECKAMLETLNKNQEHEAPVRDAPDHVSISPDRKDIEHNHVSTDDTLVDQPSMGSAMFRAAAQDGHNKLTGADRVSATVQPPKSRPLHKLRPSHLLQANKQAPEGSTETKTSPADASGKFFWTLVKKKVAEGSLSSEERTSEPLPSESPATVYESESSRGKKMPVEDCFGPTGSVGSARFTPAGSMTSARFSPVGSRISARSPLPTLSLLPVVGGRPRLPAKLPALTFRRNKGIMTTAS